MSKYDVRGYRRIRTRWAMSIMLLTWIFFMAVAIAGWGSTAILLVIPLASFSGWQQGVLVERNDWDEWYRKNHTDATDVESDA